MVFIISLIIIVFIFAMFYALAVKSRIGSAPGIDWQQGHLLHCPDTPNCINSEYPSDKAHFTAPIELPVNNNSMRHCHTVIRAMGGHIQYEDPYYLAAVFSSSLFGFVDDFEVRRDEQSHMLHVRSASRVGHSDFGINRNRVRTFKWMFQEQLNKETPE